MQFNYIALDQNSNKVKGIIDASDEKIAYLLLERQALVPLKVDVINNNIVSRKRLSPPSSKQLMTFLEQLEILLSSGISLSIALNTLAKTAANHLLKIEILNMSKMLDRGESFSTALAESKLFLPKYAIQLVRSGEITGQLKESLGSIVVQMRADLDLKKALLQALIYPTILIVFGCLAIGIIFIFVVPKFTNLLTKVHDLPLLAEFVLKTGVFLHAWKEYLVALLLFWIFLSILVFSRANSRKWIINHIIIYLPVVSHFIIATQVTRWTGMLSVLLFNKIPILDALALANQSLELKSLTGRLNLVSSKIKEGGRLTDALQDANFLSPVALDLITVGEKTGKLPEMLSSSNQIYMEDLKDKVQKTLSLIEPLSILVIGAVIGLIMSGIILAITSANDAIQL